MPPTRHKIPQVNGRALCKLHLRGVEHEESSCTRLHLPLHERPPCAAYLVAGRCARGAACWFPHALAAPAAQADSHSLVLTAPRSRLQRVQAAVSALLPEATVAARALRGDDSRGCEYALFVSCRCVPAASLLLAASALAEQVTLALWTCERCDDCGAVAQAAAAALPADASVRLRVWPSWAAQQMAVALAEAGVTLASRATATHVLDACLASGRWHWHLWPPEEAPQLLALHGRASYTTVASGGDASGTLRVASRAQFKLDELLRSGALALTSGSVCVDVGAAPGGWTLRLSQELFALEDGQQPQTPGHVFAVDPAELTLHPLPHNVTHLRMRGEDALPALLAALGSPRRSVAWVLCDANVHAPQAAAMALSMADCATLGVVLSEKRFAAGRVLHEHDVALSCEMLAAAGFSRQERVHLFSNGNNERTLVARRPE